MQKSTFISSILVAVGFFGIEFTFAQSSCHSDKVDPRVAFLLQAPDLSLEQLREMPIEVIKQNAPPNEHPVAESKMQRIKITEDSIPVIVFRPDNASTTSLRVIIDYHGGGFVAPLMPWMYGYEYDDANLFNAIVFAVDYPVAPQNRFPLTVTASYKAFKWLAQNAAIFGGDTSKIILSGGSSGANIAAAVSLMARDEGIQNKIKFVSLFCPAVDNPLTSSYPSHLKYKKGYLLTEASAIWSLETYTGTTTADTSDYRLFPIHARSFNGLPATLVFTAEFDYLHDEGEAYANKLQAAGVPVLYRCLAGQLHTLMGLPPEADEWKQMNQDTNDFIHKYL